MAKRRVKLTFARDAVTQPVIYEIGLTCKVITNIRRADITRDEGWVILELEGTDESLGRRRRALRGQGRAGHGRRGRRRRVMTPGPRVAVAMSGGVDSSVAAALLKEQGCDVIGITLQLWPKGAADRDRHHGCCSLDAVEDARRVAARLDIPYYVLDVQEEFSRRVIDPFVADYDRRPHPQPLHLLQQRGQVRPAAAQGAGYRRRHAGDRPLRPRRPRARGEHRLLRAVDPTKDQSYVLYGLTQDELAHGELPAGGHGGRLTFARRRASSGWSPPTSPTASRSASSPAATTATWWRAGRRGGSGGVIAHVDGQALGRHEGIWNYTVGQRSGLGALPKGISGPLFVLDIDPELRVVTMGPRERLGVDRIEVGELSFVAGRAPAAEFEAQVRVRYGAEPAPSHVALVADGAVVKTAAPLASVAPGQAAVLYRGDEVLGGGRILRHAAESRC